MRCCKDCRHWGANYMPMKDMGPDYVIVGVCYNERSQRYRGRVCNLDRICDHFGPHDGAALDPCTDLARAGCCQAAASPIGTTPEAGGAAVSSSRSD